MEISLDERTPSKSVSSPKNEKFELTLMSFQTHKTCFHLLKVHATKTLIQQNVQIDICTKYELLILLFDASVLVAWILNGWTKVM